MALNGGESGMFQTEDKSRGCNKAQYNTIRIILNYQSCKAALGEQKCSENSYFVPSSDKRTQNQTEVMVMV